MKYHKIEFTNDLAKRIASRENALNDISQSLLKKYKPIFNKGNMELYIEFEKKMKNPFENGYESSISIGVTDSNGDMIDFYMIPIWNCRMYFFGLPVGKNLIGSKLIGELLDETEDEVKFEIKEHIEEFLALPD